MKTAPFDSCLDRLGGLRRLSRGRSCRLRGGRAGWRLRLGGCGAALGGSRVRICRGGWLLPRQMRV